MSNRIPGRWRKAQPLYARQLNELVDPVREALRGVPLPRQVKPTTGTTVVAVRRFVIRSILPEYLVCRPWDGVEEGASDVLVARPFRLRGTETTRTFANGTVTYDGYDATGTERTATLPDASTEDQVIVPEYVVGDEIVGSRNIVGGTGVTRTFQGRTLPIDWLDLNIDARAWAETS